jgi:membrane-associated phospholipid phosphatase
MLSPTLPQEGGKWRTYLHWFFWVSVAFFSVYPSCNWITSQRGWTLQLYSAYELNIPFVPAFIWVYLTLYALFFLPPFFLKPGRLNALGRQLVAATIACGIIFMLLPADLGFARTVPEDTFYGSIFTNLFSVDLPHNLVPSLHVTFSGLILFSLMDAFPSALVRAALGSWLALICLSTLLVHQHHLLDVAAGLLVARLFYNVIGKGERYA